VLVKLPFPCINRVSDCLHLLVQRLDLLE
jgi:hypothetical protein